MYPHEYFSLFPPFPHDNTVFVAMAFHERFVSRYNEIIGPGIRQATTRTGQLQPYHVDKLRISDSVLTDILKNIAHSRLVFADITTVGETITDGHDKRQTRNANVMYEVGLAHALRLPEEVLLFRSDDDPIDFDIANVRVNSYKPEDKSGAIDMVARTVEDAIRAIETRKQIAIQKTAESLEVRDLIYLLHAVQKGKVHHQFMKQHVPGSYAPLHSILVGAAIERLVEVGAVKTDLNSIALLLAQGQGQGRAHNDIEDNQDLIPKLVESTYYVPTEFGRAICEYVFPAIPKSPQEVAVRYYRAAMEEAVTIAFKRQPDLRRSELLGCVSVLTKILEVALGRQAEGGSAR